MLRPGAPRLTLVPNSGSALPGMFNRSSMAAVNADSTASFRLSRQAERRIRVPDKDSRIAHRDTQNIQLCREPGQRGSERQFSDAHSAQLRWTRIGPVLLPHWARSRGRSREWPRPSRRTWLSQWPCGDGDRRSRWFARHRWLVRPAQSFTVSRPWLQSPSVPGRTS
jgi:hypothetical protein